MIARIVKRLLWDRKGGTAIEYGLIAALVVITMIASFMQVASVTTQMWGNINSKTSAASQGG